jgi:hypothetical protein
MELKFKNTTDFPQQIIKVNGSGINVAPGGEVNVDNCELFQEEILRLRNFFVIEEIEAPSPKKYVRNVVDKKNDGGTE